MKNNIKHDISSTAHPAPPNNRLLIAGTVAATTVFGTLAVIAPFVVSKSPLPWMATPRGKVRKALQYVNEQRGITGQGGGVFVDLGSGDGEAVYQAVRLGYSKAIGVELNYTLWAVSQFRRHIFWKTDEKARSRFVLSNFFEYDLSKANTVMIFGVKPLMPSLSQKLAQECTAGTYILCYRFSLPLAAASAANNYSGSHNDDGFLPAKTIYESQEMTILECLGSQRKVTAVK